MKKGNVEKVVRTHYEFELNVDFTETDLEIVAGYNGNYLKDLSKEYRNNIYKMGLGKLVYSGYYDEDTKTVLVAFEQNLYT